MTAFEHCLSIDESNRSQRLPAKHDLFVFEGRDALQSVVITAGSKRGFHSRPRIRVKLNSESGRETLRTAGAHEARIIETHHDDDPVAHDPFIDGAYRDLTSEVSVLARAAGPNRCFVTQARRSNVDFVPLADAKTRRSFETLRRCFRTCLTGKDEFNLI